MYETLTRIMMPKYIFENQDGRITREYYSSAKYDDVIFVGSSTVFSGIDPAILWNDAGISSYIRANASQPMWISYYMVEDAVRCHKPELVCIDTTFIKYEDDYVEEPSTRKALDGMRLSPSKIGAVNASMGEDEKMIEYIIPLFRFHTRWKELTWNDIRYAWYNKKVTLNGFIEDDEIDPVTEPELIYTAEAKELGPRNMEYLCRTIELCQENGIEVMVFKMPSHSSNWNAVYDEQIAEAVSRYKIDYINFDGLNDEIGIDYSTDTPDAGSHLNSSGAYRFSAYLADYITERFDVTDRRNDEQYVKYWNRNTNSL